MMATFDDGALVNVIDSVILKVFVTNYYQSRYSNESFGWPMGPWCHLEEHG